MLIRGQKILVQYLPESVAEIDDQVSSVTRIAVAFIGLAALVLEAPKYLLLILSQVENRGNQNSRRFGLVEDAVWKSLHHLSSNVFKVNWCDLRKNSNAGEGRRQRL